VRKARPPALIPAVAVALGIGLAGAPVRPALPLAAALIAVGWASGRGWGRLAAWLGVGLVAALVRGGDSAPARVAPDPGRPVEALVRISSHAQRGPHGWSARAQSRRLRRGAVIDLERRELVLELPPESPAPVFGSTLRVRGHLSQSAGYRNRIPVEPGPWRLRVKAPRFVTLESPASPLARLSHALRARVGAAYAAAARGSPAVARARALVLGDTSDLEPAFKRGLRRSGLAHLLAVSGFNVALVGGVALVVAFWLPWRGRLLLALVTIAGYSLLVGPLPPILRAATMGLLATVALLSGRLQQPANVLAVTVLAMLVLEPRLLRDVSFQLTASATAGLTLVAPLLEERWAALPPLLRRPLAATVAAQLATLPWALPAFHQISPWAPLANLLMVPVAAVAIVVALMWSGAAVAWPGLAQALVPALAAATAPLAWPAGPRAALWQLQPAALSGGQAALLALALAAACLRPRHGLGMAAMAALALLGWRCGGPRGGDPGDLGDFSLTMLDVGQGDAILIRDGARALLVDGGGWSEGDFGGRVLVPALAAEGVRRLDALVLTHPDRDHCAGLLDLVDYLPAEELWVAPRTAESACGRALLLRPGPRLRVLWRGERASLGRWRFQALHPPAAGGGEDNDRSLVLLGSAAGRRVLLTGDIEAAAERLLVADQPEALRADVLKVAHHGSKSSTTAAFLAAVQPRLGLISSGVHNPYGHPHPQVVARLAEHGIPVLRTVGAGMVVVRFPPGGSLRVELPGPPAPRAPPAPSVPSWRLLAARAALL
jgi:competence protein ComEC